MRSGIVRSGLMLMAAQATGQASRFPAFPKTSGKNLNGRVHDLPQDFAGRVNLVFVAFEMRQQQEVDSWKPCARGMQQTHPWLQVYELPTMGKRYSLIRALIDGGMRSGILDNDTRDSTVTLYLDVQAFARSLGIESTRTITVLLVTRRGEILARSTGPCSPGAAAVLAAALDAVQ